METNFESICMHLKPLGLVVVDIVGDNYKIVVVYRAATKTGPMAGGPTTPPASVENVLVRTSLAAAQRDGSTRPHIARSSKSGSYGVITTLAPKGVTAFFFFFDPVFNMNLTAF